MNTKEIRLALTALVALLPVVPMPSIRFAGAAPSGAQERGLGVVRTLPDKSKRYAVVIGVDTYRDKQINRLYGAAKDAKTLKDALVEYAGFPEDQVTLLATGEPEEREPSRANILQRLLNLNGVVPPDGLLLVSFAGHGIQRGERAFLLPADAKIGSLSLLENTAISVVDMKRYIRQTGVKQILVIMDACRNDPGGRADAPSPMSEAYHFDFDTRNQQVEAFGTLYATGEGQRAYEYTEKNQGYFTWTLVEGLKGAAANERGEVTLSGLVSYLQEKVPKRVLQDLGPEKRQRPWAQIEGYRADELVISITDRAATDKSTPVTANTAALELELWNSINSSTDPDDFKAYLDKYPDGTFAGVARNRIRQLGSLAESASPVTEPPGASSTRADPVSSEGGKQEHVDVQTYTETAGGAAIKMIRVPSGKFTMGSPESETGRLGDEGPQHQVSVSSFYMGKYEVTQAEWRAVATGLPKVKIDLNLDPSYFKGNNLPVENVSWNEALEFCDRLSRATDKVYRLPTEAEWEYACRAMTTGPYAGSLDSLGWYASNSGNMTHPVGTKQPNGFGLYDMHGNVWEWCRDWYSKDYPQSPSEDPRGPTTGLYPVLRGGSWHHGAVNCRSAARGWLTPAAHSNNLGFRIVAPARTN
jgi:formylglycine-generating enzyme required for sulfatase activity